MGEPTSGHLDPARLADEQARMKRELPSKPVQDYFDLALRAEEADMLIRRGKR